MKTLYLLRHAKSSWDDPGLADRERPLAPRGWEAAAAIGRHLVRFDAMPELVLCSPSRRTVETWQRVREALGERAEPRLDYREDLYQADSDTLLAAVRALPAGLDRVMLVAHEPGIRELAVALAGGGDAGALAELRRKFPTGALAVLSLPAWDEAGPGAARLREFVQPRDLS